MAAYIKINRNFRQSDFYRKSSAAQREVLWEIIHRVQYCTRAVNFDGSVMNLEIGDLYISRPKLVESLAWAGVSDSQVRNVIAKLERGNYIKLLKSSRTDGSVYRCFSRFFDEVAMPFSIKKSDNQRTTNGQSLDNQRTTIGQPKQSNSNALGHDVDNRWTAVGQPLDNERTTVGLILSYNKEEIINNKQINDDSIDFSKNDYDPFLDLKKSDLKSDLEIQRKKVAQKKESVDFKLPEVEEVDVLKNYFENVENISFWSGRYPFLEIRSEFEGIYQSLMKKAADGFPQLNSPYSYVLACLENAEKKRQQRVVAQNGKAKAKMSIVSSTQINPDKYRAAAAALQKKAK